MSSISIIIPAYNAEKTIGRCLESIFAQTCRDFEVVVVNDGSTDKTAEIVESVTKRRAPSLSDVRIITQKNQGAQAARNRGYTEIVRGLTPHNYVLFCDADIVLRQDCLEKMVCALEKHPEASYAYSSFKFGWKTFKLWPFSAERLRQMPYIHTTSLIRYSALAKDSPLAQRTVLGVSGAFDESIKRLQDWDLWLTMLEQGHTGVLIPKVLFKVISTKGTMSKWLPSFVYKLPFMKSVKKYNEAVSIIKQKHAL